MPSNSYIAPTTQPNLDFARCAALSKFNSDAAIVIASYFNGYVYSYNGTTLNPVFGSIPDIFGSWLNAALGGVVPNAYTNGGMQFVGGAVGSSNWVLNAFSGSYGLQIQTINGGTMVFNSLLPTLSYTITGTETFNAYIKLLDLPPDQIELEFYANGSWDHRVYLGTDYFNFGNSTKVGSAPTIINQWIVFTFTANDLNLVVGDIITGIGWGVWKNNSTCTVVFSDINTTPSVSPVPNIEGYIDCTQDGATGYYVLPFYGELYYATDISSGIAPVADLPTSSISYTGMKYDSAPYIIGQDGTIYLYNSGLVSTITPPPSGVTAPARFLNTDGSNNLFTLFPNSNDLGTYDLVTSGWTLTPSPFNLSLDALTYTGTNVSVAGSNAINFAASGVVGGAINIGTSQVLLTDGSNINVWDYTNGGWTLNSTVSGATDPVNIAINNKNNALVSNPTSNVVQQLNYTAGVWLSTNLALTDPTSIATTPDNLHALICQPSLNQVSVLNNSLGTWTVGQTISVANSPNVVGINSSGTYACIGTNTGVTFIKYNGAEWVSDTAYTLSATPTQIAIDSNNTSNTFFYVATVSGSTTTINIYNNDAFLASYSFSGVITSLLIVDYQIFAVLNNGDINIGICVTTGQTTNSNQTSIAPLSNTIALWYPNYILLSGASKVDEFYIVEPFQVAQTSDSMIATLSGATWLTADLQNRTRISSLTPDVSGRIIATTIDNEIYRVSGFTSVDNSYTFILTPPNGQQPSTSIGASRTTYYNNAIFSATSLYGGLIDITD